MNMRTLFIIFLFIVFALGFHLTLNAKIDPIVPKIEPMNNPEPNCPDMLIQKGAVLALYNTKQPIVEGQNPIQFSSLDDYIQYLEIQRKSGINCPVLYLQQENNAQGQDVYRMRPSPFDLQG